MAKKRKVKEQVQPAQDVWQESFFFPTAIYVLEKPSFLDIVRTVSDERIEKIKKDKELNEIYPVYMSDNYFDDPRLQEFSQYVGATAWNILNAQGYAMDNFAVSFMEMWTQEHYKHSLMEEHMHGFGSVISGFYFLECPENCSRVMINDPRPAKVITNLPERDINQVSYASNMVNFEAKPGTLMFMNSWLSHAFGRHAAEQPMKFVHFNLSVIYNQQIGRAHV